MAEEQVALHKGREGGRWVNERPSSEEFAEWFKGSMRIDAQLDVADYIGGVVLIPASANVKYVSGFRDGAPVIEQREELSYVPYAKVETRINYFWDLLGVHADEWVGVVERVTPPRVPLDFVNVVERRDASDSSWTHRELKQPSALTSMVHQLPEGFSIVSVPVGQNYSHFLCCTMKVAIYRREDWESGKKVPVRAGQGTKQVPLVLGRQSFYADSSSLMKAETGALGRALGFAGIFIIPGSGVATAEDMLESMSQGAAPAQEAPSDGEGPAAPSQAPARSGAEQADDEESALRERALALYVQLRENYPRKVEEFTEFAHKRNLRSLNEAKGATLRGVVKRLEKLIDEAQEAAADVPAKTSDEPEPATSGDEEAADGKPSGQAD